MAFPHSLEHGVQLSDDVQLSDLPLLWQLCCQLCLDLWAVVCSLVLAVCMCLPDSVSHSEQQADVVLLDERAG